MSKKIHQRLLLNGERLYGGLMHGKLQRFVRHYLDILLAFGAAYQQLVVRPQALCIKLSQEHYLRSRTESDPACIRTLSSTVACPWKITFPSR